MYEGKNHFYLHAENQNSFFVVVAVLVFHHCDSFGFVAMSSRLKSIWWTKKKKIQLKMIRFYHQPQNQWWAKQIKWNVAELFRFSSVFSTSFLFSQFVRFCIPFENIFGIFFAFVILHHLFFFSQCLQSSKIWWFFESKRNSVGKNDNFSFTILNWFFRSSSVDECQSCQMSFNLLNIQHCRQK